MLFNLGLGGILLLMGIDGNRWFLGFLVGRVLGYRRMDEGLLVWGIGWGLVADLWFGQTLGWTSVFLLGTGWLGYGVRERVSERLGMQILAGLISVSLFHWVRGNNYGLVYYLVVVGMVGVIGWWLKNTSGRVRV